MSSPKPPLTRYAEADVPTQSGDVRLVVYRVGDQADAEPALPGWRIPVADLFP